MTAPKRPTRPRRTPARTNIVQTPPEPDPITPAAAEQVLPAQTLAVNDSDTAAARAELTVDAVVTLADGTIVEQGVPGIDPGPGQLPAPDPQSVDEVVNAALLAVGDPATGMYLPDRVGPVAIWAIETIRSLPIEAPVAPVHAAPGSEAEEAAHAEEAAVLRASLDKLLPKLTNRTEVIYAAIAAAGRNTPYGPSIDGAYRADLAGVIGDWLESALAVHNTGPAPEATNVSGGPLYNGGLLDGIAASHRDGIRG